MAEMANNRQIVNNNQSEDFGENGVFCENATRSHFFVNC